MSMFELHRETDDFDPRYIAARRVLLDALTALAPHRGAVIVAGAQAIYLRTGAGELSIAPYTTDGDLAIDPSMLGDDPALATAMEEAGFHLQQSEGGHFEPGVWIRAATVEGDNVLIPVDLIVPEAVAPRPGRRDAYVAGHGERATRRAVGLEAALVDHGPMTIAALEAADTRSVNAEVAGSPALLVAKLHKLHDRVDRARADRLEDKDAADVIRIMQTSPAVEVGATFNQLLDSDVARAVTEQAITYLDGLFGRRGRAGIEMAARALRLDMPEERIEVIATAYTAAVAEAIGP